MTRRLPGSLIASPVTVVIRVVSGFPSVIASKTAIAVLGF